MTNSIKTFFSIVSTMFLLAGCGVQGGDEDTTGYVPECSYETPCGDGYACVDGTCQERPQVPDPECRLNSDCGANQVCVAETCQSVPPAPPPACRLNSDCAVDKVCTAGTCVDKPVVTPDPECTCDLDCGTDEVCSADGTCVDKPVAIPDPECTCDEDCGEGKVCSADQTCVDKPVTTDGGAPTCPEEYTCGEWSACSNGSKARECSRTCSDGTVQNMTNGEECTTTPDAGPAAPEYIPDPVRSPKACVLDFSSYYMSGATDGEVRGEIPGLTWERGLTIADPNTNDDYAYAGITWSSKPSAGTYDISYVGYQGEEAPAQDAWAQYGLREDLSRMRPEALEYIQCNWYVNGEVVEVDAPECHIRVTFDRNCGITGAGNMGEYAGE